MKFFRLLLLASLASSSVADTMEHYMNIASSIPKMEIKADAQSQAWARSARNVLALTNETLAETLIHINQIVQKSGQPLFCLPAGVNLNAEILGELIVSTYNAMGSQQSDKNKMSVSQLGLVAVRNKYPCQGTSLPQNTSSSSFQGLTKALPAIQQMQQANS